ncbi:hypothetical protein BU14_0138s0026 [Porphyra umbilicalis]|uniref:Uncharacterized protein n=1 Tax=Porphyra umbilicalis TaxID=2786 RepID=A0A1X6PAA1_PORUM|nr:hypothetical protein BU14_0138s0026 [Porphyra umbilicalis]|eukprot:OSX77680.1 hypothetical protein BU14_0138s0026 [Porphyra umbilicalis]
MLRAAQWPTTLTRRAGGGGRRGGDGHGRQWRRWRRSGGSGGRREAGWPVAALRTGQWPPPPRCGGAGGCRAAGRTVAAPQAGAGDGRARRGGCPTARTLSLCRGGRGRAAVRTIAAEPRWRGGRPAGGGTAVTAADGAAGDGRPAGAVMRAAVAA